MSSNARKVKRWRIKTKKRMIAALGNNCCICGYNNCRDSLTFHHLNPKEKRYTISQLLSKIRPWEEIAEELEKCVLVCTNCHAEIHAGVTKVPKYAKRFKLKHGRKHYVNDKKYGSDRYPIYRARSYCSLAR